MKAIRRSVSLYPSDWEIVERSDTGAGISEALRHIISEWSLSPQSQRTRPPYQPKAPDPTVSESTMHSIANAVINDGASFSRTSLYLKFGLISQTNYHRLAFAMERAGYLDRTSSKTRRLTPSGIGYLKSFLD